MSKKGSIHRHFSDDFKISIVEEFLSGSFSQHSLCKKYSLHGGSLREWIRIFAPEYEFASDIMSKKPSENDQIRELKLALRQKELELKREKMRGDLYETIIEVAEEQFQIPIRKKAGTKR